MLSGAASKTGSMIAEGVRWDNFFRKGRGVKRLASVNAGGAGALARAGQGRWERAMKMAQLEHSTQLDSRSIADALTMSGMEGTFGQSSWVCGAVVLMAYAIGCFTTGYYLVRLGTGQDIRTLGTGSCGARNVSRFLGSRGFALTLSGDLLKGGLAVWLAQRLTHSDTVSLLALVAVTIGHVWPAQLGFRGGKGIAVSLAGMLILDPLLTALYLLLFGVVFVLTRRTVASSLIAYALLPAASTLAEQGMAHVLGVALLATFILTAHSQNIAHGFRLHNLRGGPAPSDL